MTTYRKWACNSFRALSTHEALTNKAKDQDCGKKKLYPILFQKEKMRWKGNCLCLLPFAEQKRTHYLHLQGLQDTIKNYQFVGHSSYQSNLIVFDSLLIYVDVVKMADSA